MIGKLVDLLPDSMKGISSTLIPAPPPPRVPVLSANFEYMPIQPFLAGPQQHTENRENSQLCLIACTSFGVEVWVLADFRKFQRLYFKSESGIRIAHYVPLAPERDEPNAKSVDSVRDYLNSSLPILAIAKPTEEYSPALGIHLFSLKNSKYFHVIRFTSELVNFEVGQHVIAATLRGGQIRIFDLRTLEQHSALDTIFLSKEMHDLVSSEEPGCDSETQASIASFIKEVVPACDVTTHLIAFVRHDIVSESKFNEVAKSLLGTQLIQEHSFAKETTQKLFALGELGYTKVMNIFNTRKAANLTTDPNGAFELLSPTSATAKKSHPQPAAANNNSGSEEEKERKAEAKEVEEENSEGDGEFVEVSPAGDPGLSTESRNKITVVIQRLADSAVLASIVPPYFHNVTLVKFSPSGALLLVANENAQQFYIYKLFPETNFRHVNSKASGGRTAMLLYSIFRGYTSATVSSVAFSLCERWLIINSAKGTSHIYRLDENFQHVHDPVLRNSSAFDYNKNDAISRVINLSAFSRFKYDAALTQGDLWPVTAIVSHYPLSKLGTKKEVLLRMGAVFYKAAGGKGGEDEGTADIPLFVSITSRAEVYTNAMLTFNTEAKAAEEQGEDACDTAAPYGQKDYEMLKKKRLPSRGNYYNDKLLVENLAKFELGLEARADKSQDFLDKNVVTVTTAGKERRASKSAAAAGKPHSETDPKATILPAMEEQKETEQEQIRKRQKRWLKEIETANCSTSTPSLRICPQFTFCTRGTESAAEPVAAAKPDQKDEAYEKVLSSETEYRQLDPGPQKEGCDVAFAMHDLHGAAGGKPQRGDMVNETATDTNPERNDNPFYDNDEDKEFEEKLAKALNSSISAARADEPEQKSQIFQGEIKVLDNYNPQKKSEMKVGKKEEDVEKSEYD